ncbi:glycosyltransferase family 39 protein [Methylotuvimicrobium sp. KM2]|uniref:glycosyltransferase family 39 protein n=1 Tax=Methylotuvimicrobium sp. KM2 TaxID=3133976 RepID=UPI00310157B9
MLIVVVAFVAIGINRIGYQGFEDDTNYLIAANGWLQNPPFIAENHWQTRLPLILTISTSIALLGQSEFSVSLGASIFYLALIVVLVYTVKSLIDQRTALVFGTLIATSPLLAIYGTTLYPEIYELFFAMAGVSLFLMVAEKKLNNDLAPLFFSGILLGLAFLTRETSSAILLFLIILFLAGYGPLRSRYWFMAGGFLLVVISEAVFYWYYTGELLYRYQLDSGHAQIFSNHLKGGVYDGSPFFSIKLMSLWVSDSPFPIHWFIDPFVTFFISPAYGGVFLFALFALVMLLKSKTLDNKTKKVLKFSIFISIVWFFFIVYVLVLRPQSRYFLPLIVAANLLISIFYSNCLVPRRPLIANILIGTIIIINLILIDLRQDPRYIPKLLTSTAKRYDEPIYARADWIKSASALHTNKERSQLKPLPAPQQGLLFTESASAQPTIGKIIDVIKGPRPLSLLLISNFPLISEKVSNYMNQTYPEFCVVRSQVFIENNKTGHNEKADIPLPSKKTFINNK